MARSFSVYIVKVGTIEQSHSLFVRNDIKNQPIYFFLAQVTTVRRISSKRGPFKGVNLNDFYFSTYGFSYEKGIGKIYITLKN